jgi:GT2 family glycosyltransferase
MQAAGHQKTNALMFEPEARLLGAIDFLAIPMCADDGLERTGDTFTIHRPWARLRVPRAMLRPGWWLVECNMEGGSRTAEVQISSPSDPLIVLNGHNAGSEYIYLQHAGPYEIALLISAWPGRVRVKRLRLRRLSEFEASQRIASAAWRVLRNPNRLDVLKRIGQRLIAGQALGMRSAASDPAKVVVPVTPLEAQTRQAAIEHAESWSGVRVILGAGDTVDPRARRIVEDTFAASPGLKALYSDALEDGRIVIRKAWDPELARWHDLAGLPVFVREDSWRDGEPAWAQLTALAASSPNTVGHIPLPLAERPPQPTPVLKSPPQPILARYPRVSVLLPTKVRLDLLKKCLEGLSTATGYPDVEVVVIDNGSEQKVLLEVLDEARRSLSITTVADNGDFNFSRLINAGAKAATGEVILILNDDVEPIQPGWLHRIVESVLSTGVGAVGARLLYPDGSIQHAGVALGIGGVCGHLYKGTSREEAERTAEIVYPGSRMAVTGACLAVRRDVFDAVQGFDDQLPVALNDIDFCLRLGATGYRNIYRGDAVLIHHESQSRGADDISVVSRRRLARETVRFLARWRQVIESDPFSSPALDRQSERGVAHRALQSQA